MTDPINDLPDPCEQLTRMLAFAGIIKGGGPESLGRMVDEIVYGPGS
jgi:hypothetical protein